RPQRAAELNEEHRRGHGEDAPFENVEEVTVLCPTRWHFRNCAMNRDLEAKPNAEVCRTTLERRPLLYSPSPAFVGTRSQQWVETRLTHVRQVVAVHINLRTPDLPRREQADCGVWLRDLAERIVFEPLAADIEHLDTDARVGLIFPR